MGRHLFPLKRTRKPGHPPCRGEPVHFPPNVRVVGGPVSHGWATFARRVHESVAGASRVNRLLAFSCCSGPVWGGGRWASAVASHLIQPRDHVWSSAIHGAEPGHGLAEFRAIRVGRSPVVSGPRLGVCCPLTAPVFPLAFRFQKHQRLFSLRFAVYGRKDEFQCRKKCRQQLRRCPIT